MVEIEEKIIAAIEAEVKKLYSTELLYHNYGHAEEVRKQSQSLIKSCEDRGLGPINKVVVGLAVLFHDAGYYEDHAEKGFATKEKYSAYLAQEVLGKYFQLEQEKIDQVVSAIIATEKDSPAVTLEEKIVRHADLAGFGAGYEVFVLNTTKLKWEAEKRACSKISWQKWKEWTISLLSNYPLYLDDILIEEEAKHYRKQLLNNLERLEGEDEEYLQKLYDGQFKKGAE